MPNPIPNLLKFEIPNILSKLYLEICFELLLY